MGKLIWLIVLLHCLCFPRSSKAQDRDMDQQDPAIIKGSRFMPYPNYSGKPYLYDKFLFGEIEMSDGTRIKNIGLSYSTYRDELIYYNSKVSAQIVIDKNSLKSFTLTDPNSKTNSIRHFRKQKTPDHPETSCFMEVLEDGEVSLLVFRQVNLESCDTYYSKSGLAYQPAYIYYLYAQGKGYVQVNLNRNSLLSRFDLRDQKLIKKLLRKSGSYIGDESGLVKAWRLLMANGFKPKFS